MHCGTPATESTDQRERLLCTGMHSGHSGRAPQVAPSPAKARGRDRAPAGKLASAVINPYGGPPDKNVEALAEAVKDLTDSDAELREFCSELTLKVTCSWQSFSCIRQYRPHALMFRKWCLLESHFRKSLYWAYGRVCTRGRLT